jgi:hemerythrin-like domain-containing protein
MRIQIGKAPEHGFDEPLGLLSDCHRRIERFLWAMHTLASRGRGGPLGAADRDVVEQCRRYFATAGPRHTADEEESLFPRLRASADAGAREALDRVDRLEADHRAAEERHERVDGLFARWLGQGTLSEEDTAALIADLEGLQAIYGRHIAIEDNEVFPAAASALSREELLSIGREMAARRKRGV